VADLAIVSASVEAAARRPAVHRSIAGATILGGQPLYADSATGHLKPARANALATAAVVGISLHEAEDGQPVAYLTAGPLRINPVAVPGVVYLLSASAAGGIAADQDLITGQYVTVLGVAIAADIIEVQVMVAGLQRGSDLMLPLIYSTRTTKTHTSATTTETTMATITLPANLLAAGDVVHLDAGWEIPFAGAPSQPKLQIHYGCDSLVPLNIGKLIFQPANNLLIGTRGSFLVQAEALTQISWHYYWVGTNTFFQDPFVPCSPGLCVQGEQAAFFDPSVPVTLELTAKYLTAEAVGPASVKLNYAVWEIKKAFAAVTIPA
jgi:hypothetical protein